MNQPERFMKNTYRFIWSEEAINGLNVIIKYIENNFSEKVVKKFISRFDKYLELIKSNPEAFSLTPKSKNIRRSIVAKLTSIYYIVDNQDIYLVSIRDNRMKPKKIKI